MSESINTSKYYISQSLITDPQGYGKLYKDLPADIPSLCKVIQGVMMHYESAKNIHQIPLTAKQDGANLRHVSKLLARIQDLDDHALVIARPFEKRLAVVCRDFAVMLCSLLRHQAVPARARCGFASYFQGSSMKPGFWHDH